MDICRNIILIAVFGTYMFRDWSHMFITFHISIGIYGCFTTCTVITSVYIQAVADMIPFFS